VYYTYVVIKVLFKPRSGYVSIDHGAQVGATNLVSDMLFEVRIMDIIYLKPSLVNINALSWYLHDVDNILPSKN